jgi:hypothetical protein
LSEETTEIVADNLQTVIEQIIAGKDFKTIVEEAKEGYNIKKAMENLRSQERKIQRTYKECNKILKSEHNLRIHMNKKHKITCPICKVKVKDQDKLEVHNQRIHKSHKYIIQQIKEKKILQKIQLEIRLEICKNVMMDQAQVLQRPSPSPSTPEPLEEKKHMSMCTVHMHCMCTQNMYPCKD